MQHAHEARRAHEYVDDVTGERDGAPATGWPAKRPLEAVRGDLAIQREVGAAPPVIELVRDAPQSVAQAGVAPAPVDLAVELLARHASSRVREQEARAGLRSLPLAKLLEVFKNAALRDALPQLVPLLKVSDVVPCLQSPGMVELVLPCLDPSQCKLLGPELATLIAPHLHRNWTLLDHLPLETVVLVPTTTFLALPLPVLRQLPDPHQQYLAPYVKGARKVSHDRHDLACAQGLCEILHLHAHKVLDPEHIPGSPQLRALQRGRSLRAKLLELRWLVDAVMVTSVEAVQLGSLKLSTLIVALRKVGLTGLAGDLEASLRKGRRSRNQLHGASGIAYARDRVVAVQHAQIGELPPPARAGALRDALDDGFARHAGMHDQLPLPSPHYVPVICVELATPAPPSSAGKWHELEVALHDQLGEPCNGVAIQEVRLRWADATTAVYRRHGDGRYRRS